MARETLQITLTTINAALRVADNSKIEREYGDTQVRGLCLRVRRRTVTWALRCRLNDQQCVFHLGSVATMRDLDLVRKIAEKGKAMAAAGEDPRAFFKATLVAGSIPEAEAVQRQRTGQEWTWDECRERYLEFIKATQRPETYRSYKGHIRHKGLKALDGRLLSQITANDIREVRDVMIARGKLRQLTATMQQLKACLDWAVDQKESGITEIGSPAERVKTKWKIKTVGQEEALADMQEDVEPRGTFGRYLSDYELGTLQWEADTIFRPEHRWMLIIELFTAQRRYTVASAIKSAFRKHPEYGMTWVIHPGSRKTGSRRPKRPHVIPLPEPAQKAVEVAMMMSKADSKWLFPQLRLRRAGDKGGGHISVKSLNDVMRSMQAPGRLLHSKRPFSPHALRRSFTTYMSKLKVKQELYDLITEHDGPKADPKLDELWDRLITDMGEGRGDSVSEAFYNAHQMLPEKAEVMDKWTSFLLEVKEKFDPKRGTAAAA